MAMTNSQDLFEKSQKVIPGGVNSPVRAFGSVGRTPVFMKKAKGSRIFDEDGNSYVDYVCSWGPGILGHADDRVIDAVKAACDDGLTFGAPTRKELEIAELVNELMPSMELTRMVNSGTEAVMSALRVARGFTGRDKIVKFRGCYHGHSDGLLVKAGSAALTQSVPDSLGVPKSYTQHTLIAEYNNEDSVKKLFEAEGKDIAAIVVEPVAANMGVVPPHDGFLQFLRDITNEYGALLIFDEVITGFRLSLGGAQEYFGVKPDLTTLGKIVGGGMPVGAYGGRRDVMSMVAPLGGVYQAGTLSGNPIAMNAPYTPAGKGYNISGDRKEHKADSRHSQRHTRRHSPCQPDRLTDERILHRSGSSRHGYINIQRHRKVCKVFLIHAGQRTLPCSITGRGTCELIKKYKEN